MSQYTHTRYTLTGLPDSSDPLPLIKTNHLLDFYKESDLLPPLKATEDQGFEGSTDPSGIFMLTVISLVWTDIAVIGI